MVGKIFDSGATKAREDVKATFEKLENVSVDIPDRLDVGPLPGHNTRQFYRYLEARLPYMLVFNRNIKKKTCLGDMFDDFSFIKKLTMKIDVNGDYGEISAGEKRVSNGQYCKKCLAKGRLIWCWSDNQIKDHNKNCKLFH